MLAASRKHIRYGSCSSDLVVLLVFVGQAFGLAFFFSFFPLLLLFAVFLLLLFLFSVFVFVLFVLGFLLVSVLILILFLRHCFSAFFCVKLSSLLFGHNYFGYIPRVSSSSCSSSFSSQIVFVQDRGKNRYYHNNYK